MKIQRTIPPAAAPVDVKSIVSGLTGFLSPQSSRERREQEFRGHFDVKHVFFVSSGKAALTLILRALHSLVPGKRKVLIPAYTCYSVPSAIVKAGLEVALCDLGAETFDFDYARLSASIDSDTLCVVPTHLFGIPADMKRVQSACSGKSVFIVEDAAQAMGGKYDGRPLGAIGDIGFFSFGRGKNLTCGSGGAIVTNNDKIAAAISGPYASLESPRLGETAVEFVKMLFLALFINPAWYWFPAGLPFLKLGETVFEHDFPVRKLSGMQAGFLKNWQSRLHSANSIRKEHVQFYSNNVGGALAAKNDTLPLIRYPLMTASRQDRDALFSLSQLRGLGISRMYPAPIHEITELQHLFEHKIFPGAKEAAERLVTLPTHGLLTGKDQERISSLCTTERKAMSPHPGTSEKTRYAL